MEKIVVDGGYPLSGKVEISGMKNAAVAVIFATVVSSGVCVIDNLPEISDVADCLAILQSVGARIRMISRNKVEIDTTDVRDAEAPLDLVRKIRASYYLAGAMLGRFGKVKVGLPGGCNFGVRPIDLHVKAFEKLGATVDLSSGCIDAAAENGLKGANIYFDSCSVGATINAIIAAVMADGLTVIENPAKEPHIVDVANFLSACGADIRGAGTSVIKIYGGKPLHGCEYAIIPDMIEAGTYMAAVAATGGEVNIKNVIPKHLEIISTKLVEMGVEVRAYDDYITVKSDGKLKPTNIQTLPYPGFPTDMHPQFSTLLAIANGDSTVYETIWKNRFKYVKELEKMGANITVNEPFAAFHGVEKLHGATVRSVDLRAGAAIVIAGLVAEGTTEVIDIFTIERGYLDIVGKLKELGADISKVYIDENAFI